MPLASVSRWFFRAPRRAPSVRSRRWLLPALALPLSLLAALPPPSALIAISGHHTLTLQWEPSPGATRYTIHRRTTANSGSYSTVALDVRDTSYTDTGLVNGTPYFYVVTAGDTSGASAPSNQARGTPFARPPAGSVRWPLANSSAADSDGVRYCFGPRDIGRYDFHAGFDLNAAVGTPVHAVMDGTVANIREWDGVSTAGNNILLRHADEHWTGYLHLNAFAADLKVGDRVTAGQVIGYVGKTGAKSAHLHITYMVGLTGPNINEARSRCPLELLPHTGPPAVTASFRTDGSNTFDFALPAQQNTLRWVIVRGSDGLTRVLDFYDVIAQGLSARDAQNQYGLFLDASPPTLAYPAGGGTLRLSVGPSPDAPFTPTRLILKDYNGITVLDRAARPPAPPAGFTAVPVLPASAELAWQPVSDADSYELERRAGDGAPWLSLGSIDALSSRFTDTPLPFGAVYGYRLRAVNTAGASAFSPIAEIILPPVFISHPASQTVALGEPVTFTSAVAGDDTVAYQWFKDSVAIPGATAASFTLARATLADAGRYWVTGTTGVGMSSAEPATLSVQAPPDPTYLSNLSVRGALAAGQTLIMGFVVEGAPKPILLRAAGPALASTGLSFADDPHLTLYDGPGTAIAANDDWSADLAPLFSQLGAAPFAASSRDAALLASVTGPHTAHATASSPGVVLVEAYDAGPDDGRKLTNLSARFHVGTGDNILIAGFVIGGTGSRQVLVRAVGPALLEQGVTGILRDPQFFIFDADGSPIAFNDDWNSALAPVFDQVGAFPLAPGSKDAALVLTLPAGQPHTVQVSGVGGATGEALVEIYDVR